MITDAFLTYQFVKRFVLPFSKWKAHDLGIIDSAGNVLKRRRDLVTEEERLAFGTFDLLVLNMKKAAARIPGGGSVLASAALTSLLMKEDAEAVASDVEWLLEDAPTNSVGSGQVAGAGIGPQGEPAKRGKFKKARDILRRKVDARIKSAI